MVYATTLLRRLGVGVVVSLVLASPFGATAQEDSEPQEQPKTTSVPGSVSYEEAVRDLHQVLGRSYPCFQMKGIDWEAVGRELLPRAKEVKTDQEFLLLCIEMVARLEDSHAQVNPGIAALPDIPIPRWDPGFACLVDDRDQLVVYHVDPGSPAEKAGLLAGMTLLSIQGKSAEEALVDCMRQLSRYSGHSSERNLRYHAARSLARQMEKDAVVAVEVQDLGGQTHELTLPASLGPRYLPRLPVAIPGIRDAGNVSWTMLDDRIGYIYVRRTQRDLVERLDQAVGELKDAKGLIVDVRGNSGGGFEGGPAHRNFSPDDKAEPQRPRFGGPIAVLIDPRCISAGEGWASWFVANRRAKLFGEATAGASSAKTQYSLKNGLCSVTIPVRPRRGFLDRPIERRGLEPDVPLRQNAKDLAAGRDTALEAAKQYLLEQ